jgi:hypothetical protein
VENQQQTKANHQPENQRKKSQPMQDNPKKPQWLDMKNQKLQSGRSGQVHTRHGMETYPTLQA